MVSNRAAEAPELVALGRSITEPAVQLAYRQYVQALTSIIRPDYIGLAAETNLIREQANARGVCGARADDQCRGERRTRDRRQASADVREPSGRRGVGTAAGGVSRRRDGLSRLSIHAGDRHFIVSVFRVRRSGSDSARLLRATGQWPRDPDDGGRRRLDVGVGGLRAVIAEQSRLGTCDGTNACSTRRRRSRSFSSTTRISISRPIHPNRRGRSSRCSPRLGFVDTELRAKSALATHDSIFSRPLRK